MGSLTMERLRETFGFIKSFVNEQVSEVETKVSEVKTRVSEVGIKVDTRQPNWTIQKTLREESRPCVSGSIITRRYVPRYSIVELTDASNVEFFFEDCNGVYNGYPDAESEYIIVAKAYMQGSELNLLQFRWPSPFSMRWPDGQIPNWETGKVYAIYISGGNVAQVADITSPKSSFTAVFNIPEEALNHNLLTAALLYNSGNFEVYLDGEKLGEYITFSTPGEHTVVFKWSKESTEKLGLNSAKNMQYFWAYCTKLDFSELDPDTDIESLEGLNWTFKYELELALPKYQAVGVGGHVSFRASTLKSLDLGYLSTAQLSYLGPLGGPNTEFHGVAPGFMPPGAPSRGLNSTFSGYKGDAKLLHKYTRALIKTGGVLNQFCFKGSSIEKVGSVLEPWPITEISTNAFFDCSSLEFVHISTIRHGLSSIFNYNCASLKELIISDTGRRVRLHDPELSSYGPTGERISVDKLVLNCDYLTRPVYATVGLGFDTTYPTTVYYKEGADLDGFLEDLPEAWTAVPFNDLSEIPFQYAPAEDE